MIHHIFAKHYLKMKKTAYIITILANIILLAYAVVPHHHHKYQVCLLSEHCQTNDFDDTENHHHDSQTKSNNCLLSQAILLPIGNNTKEDQSIVYNYGFDVFINTTHELSTNHLVINSIEILTPDSLFIFSSYINNSLGLRAPPAI